MTASPSPPGTAGHERTEATQGGVQPPTQGGGHGGEAGPSGAPAGTQDPGATRRPAPPATGGVQTGDAGTDAARGQAQEMARHGGDPAAANGQPSAHRMDERAASIRTESTGSASGGPAQPAG